MSYIKNIRKKIGHDPIFAPASGCIIIKNNKVLLQKRSDDNKWALHGGYLELGESFIEAMERKVKEEIGVKPINPKLVNIYTGKDAYDKYPNGDEVYGIIAIYIAYDYEGTLKFDLTDICELKWFDINNLPEDIHEVDNKPLKEAIANYLKDKSLQD